jgi:hypothetical protein
MIDMNIAATKTTLTATLGFCGEILTALPMLMTILAFPPTRREPPGTPTVTGATPTRLVGESRAHRESLIVFLQR